MASKDRNNNRKEGGEVKALSCSRCAAPLKPEGDEDFLTCEYCGQVHRFEAPPPAAKEHGHAAGQAVLVKWGVRWWKAKVVRVTGGDRWLIHYDGWASKWDEEVGPDRICAAPKGSKAGGGRTRAVVAAVAAACIVAGGLAGFFLVTDEPSSVIGPVEPSSVVNTGVQLSVGDKVQVRWRDGWYIASVLRVEENGDVYVSFDGYGSEWNDTVTRDRIRLIAPGTEAPAGGQAEKKQVLPPNKEVTPQTKLEVGRKLLVSWYGKWYPGEVLSLEPDGKVKIHFTGWDSKYDEIVERDRLRVPLE